MRCTQAYTSEINSAAKVFCFIPPIAPVFWFIVHKETFKDYQQECSCCKLAVATFSWDAVLKTHDMTRSVHGKNNALEDNCPKKKVP